jgi:hypothetical protein
MEFIMKVSATRTVEFNHNQNFFELNVKMQNKVNQPITVQFQRKTSNPPPNYFETVYEIQINAHTALDGITIQVPFDVTELFCNTITTDGGKASAHFLLEDFRKGNVLSFEIQPELIYFRHLGDHCLFGHIHQLSE